MNIFSSLFAPIADIGKAYLSNRAEVNKAKHEAKLQKIQNTADWETKMADASANSWKDEWFTVLLSIPLLMIGYAVVKDDPTIIARLKEGFSALEELPDFYQYLLFVAVTSSFGLKGADKIMNLRKKSDGS